MQKVRNEIRFILNERKVVLSDLRAHDTLLDYLRLSERLTGTKEGCAEGDCGACTVLIGRLVRGEFTYQPINACIKPLVSCDLSHVVTVEHISRDGLVPVQEAMVRHHASQCGFCTPGFVMALYALRMNNPEPSRDEVLRAIQGNLCRCTGYAPIVRAALDIEGDRDILEETREEIVDRLTSWNDGARVEVGQATIPADADDLADVLGQNPNATIIAGATDVGLWVTKSMRQIEPAVFVGDLPELSEITVKDDHLHVGASVTYTDLEPVLARHFEMLDEYWSRIGGWQIRNAGTIGGNIANGSPIGDTPPWLIAMGADLVLRSRGRRRSIPLEDFFVDYGKQDLRDGEFVEALTIPLLGPDDRLVVRKVSKRRDEDISSVAFAMRFRLEGKTIRSVRIAFGGMAATPRRAVELERALEGRRWSEDVLRDSVAKLESDFAPMSDQRASAVYRMSVAKNLLLRAFHELEGDAA